MTNREAHRHDVSGLLNHAKQKSQEARTRVSDAIDRLSSKQAVVNFNTVAKEAGVTKSYLYTQPDLRERIDAIRLLQAQNRHRLIAVANSHNGRSDRSKDVLLAAKERRIRDLEAENRKLKEEVKTLHGKLYEKL